MHAQGESWAKIAARLGYPSGKAAYGGAVRAARRDPVQDRMERIEEEEHRINWLIGQAVAILQEHHYVIEGRDAVIVEHPLTGEYLDDYRPKIDALKLIQSLSRDKRRLLGLDVPTRRVVEVITDDRITQEIQRLESEMANNDQLMQMIAGNVSSTD